MNSSFDQLTLFVQKCCGGNSDILGPPWLNKSDHQKIHQYAVI
jgi:hypothetical protein